MNGLRLLAFSVLFSFALGQPVGAYWFENGGLWWPNGYVWFYLQLQATQYLLGPRTPVFPMWDYSPSFEASFRDAMFDWDYFIWDIQFEGVTANFTAGSVDDGVNNVKFGNESGGQSFDSDTLAVSEYLCYTSVPVFAEADITFNSNVYWQSFRGPLKPYAVFDFHRVALHELGHALGLDHPDQNGQNVSAIMNSTVSNTDFLTADDIAGAQQLYGVRPH